MGMCAPGTAQESIQRRRVASDVEQLQRGMAAAKAVRPEFEASPTRAAFAGGGPRLCWRQVFPEGNLQGREQDILPALPVVQELRLPAGTTSGPVKPEEGMSLIQIHSGAVASKRQGVRFRKSSPSATLPLESLFQPFDPTDEPQAGTASGCEHRFARGDSCATDPPLSSQPVEILLRRASGQIVDHNDCMAGFQIALGIAPTCFCGRHHRNARLLQDCK